MLSYQRLTELSHYHENEADVLTGKLEAARGLAEDLLEVVEHFMSGMTPGEQPDQSDLNDYRERLKSCLHD